MIIPNIYAKITNVPHHQSDLPIYQPPQIGRKNTWGFLALRQRFSDLGSGIINHPLSTINHH
jgi:ribosomal protein L34